MIINGLNYHYIEAGQSLSNALVMLHGFTGSTSTWQSFFEPLAKHYHVIAIDLPGHGLTDSPPSPQRYAMQHVAHDITEIIRRLHPVGDVHLLGYSMGGRLALYTAIHFAALCRSLALESASPGLKDASAREARKNADNRLADWIEQVGILEFVNYWETLPLFETQQRYPERLANLRAQRLRNNPTGLANSLRGMGTGAQMPLWSKLSDCKLPTLLITGEQDAKFHSIAIDMARQLTNASHVNTPNAGHTVHFEEPNRFLDDIMTFVGRFRSTQ